MGIFICDEIPVQKQTDSFALKSQVLWYSITYLILSKIHDIMLIAISSTIKGKILWNTF